MADLISPINRLVERNITPPTQEKSAQGQISADSLVEALASKVGAQDSSDKQDKFSWANEPETRPDSQVDFDDLQAKGVDSKTLAMLRDLEAQEPVKRDSEGYADETDKQKLVPTHRVLPKLDASKLVDGVDFSKIYDAKAFLSDAVGKLQANPIHVNLTEELMADIKESNLDYLPGLMQHYSHNAAQRGAELAINHILGSLPGILKQYSEALSTNVQSSTHEADVLSYFDDDLEVLIAKTYAPKYMAKNPGADAQQVAQAIKDYIDSKQNKKATKPPAQQSDNPWFRM